MKTILLFVAGISCLVACKPAADISATVEVTAAPVGEPMLEKRPHEMTLHGHTRVDEYYWLRDDSRKDPQMLAYLEAENAYFDKTMEHTAAMQETLYEEMTGRLDPDDSSVPTQVDDYWYYYRYEPGGEYPIHARRKGGMDASEEILLDGNQRANGREFYSLRGWEVSDDHRYIAIAEDTIGRRINEIRILDTQSGEFLPDLIGNASDSLAGPQQHRHHRSAVAGGR